MDSSDHSTLRRRTYLVVAVFVAVVIFNFWLSMNTRRAIEQQHSVETQRHDDVKQIFAELEQKRDQASRMLDEAERRLAKATAKPGEASKVEPSTTTPQPDEPQK
jgi:cytoskeletal protein RodZ